LLLCPSHHAEANEAYFAELHEQRRKLREDAITEARAFSRGALRRGVPGRANLPRFTGERVEHKHLLSPPTYTNVSVDLDGWIVLPFYKYTGEDPDAGDTEGVFADRDGLLWVLGDGRIMRRFDTEQAYDDQLRAIVRALRMRSV